MRNLKSILMLLVIFIFPCSSAAYQLPLSGVLKVHELEQALLNQLSAISSDPLLIRSSALEQKLTLAIDYDERVEAFNAGLREFTDQIYFLNESLDNLRRIKTLTEDIKALDRWLSDARTALLKRHADLSIPMVIAGYVEVSLDQDSLKGTLFRAKAREHIINESGVHWIRSEVVFENETLQHDLIHESVSGTVEEDPGKIFDHELIERNGDVTSFFTIAFFRYKPFADIREMRVVPTSEISSGRVVLEEVRFENRGNILNLVKRQFSTIEPGIINSLRKYLDNILRLENGVDQSAERIKYVLGMLNALNDKHQFRLNSLKNSRRRLDEENRKIFESLGIGFVPNYQDIVGLISEKTAEIERKKAAFQYRVIVMGDYPSRDFKDGIRQSLQSLARRTCEMTRRTGYHQDSRLENDEFSVSTENRNSFEAHISKVVIWPYVEGSRVGVLLDATFEYPSGGEQSESFADSSYRLGFDENLKGISLYMMSLQDNQASFISEGEITKRQFKAFNESLTQHLDKRCVASLGINHYPGRYPANFPLLCVNREGQEAFANWLAKKTGMQYKVADEYVYNLSSAALVLNKNPKAFRVYINSAKSVDR